MPTRLSAAAHDQCREELSFFGVASCGFEQGGRRCVPGDAARALHTYAPAGATSRRQMRAFGNSYVALATGAGRLLARAITETLAVGSPVR